MERAWTRAVELAPENAAAWSNRGTARLQAGRWRDAYDDLSYALQLETRAFGGDNVADGVSALLLNQLANSEGALGRWEVRCRPAPRVRPGRIGDSRPAAPDAASSRWLAGVL
jgi:tetratricopeptide (TPR) repeat protein